MHGSMEKKMMRKGKQIAGEDYNSNSLSSPFTNVENFRVVLVLSIIFRWANKLLHVKGMFSCGKYQHENPIYMNVPEEFEQDYT
jgi:hypothetical protein